MRIMKSFLLLVFIFSSASFVNANEKEQFFRYQKQKLNNVNNDNSDNDQDAIIIINDIQDSSAPSQKPQRFKITRMSESDNGLVMIELTQVPSFVEINPRNTSHCFEFEESQQAEMFKHVRTQQRKEHKPMVGFKMPTASYSPGQPPFPPLPAPIPVVTLYPNHEDHSFDYSEYSGHVLLRSTTSSASKFEEYRMLNVSAVPEKYYYNVWHMAETVSFSQTKINPSIADVKDKKILKKAKCSFFTEWNSNSFDGSVSP